MEEKFGSNDVFPYKIEEDSNHIQELVLKVSVEKDSEETCRNGENYDEIWKYNLDKDTMVLGDKFCARFPRRNELTCGVEQCRRVIKGKTWSWTVSKFSEHLADKHHVHLTGEVKWCDNCKNWIKNLTRLHKCFKGQKEKCFISVRRKE